MDWLHLIVPFYISIYVFVEAFHIGTKDVKCVFLLNINIYNTDEKLQLCSDVQAPWIFSCAVRTLYVIYWKGQIIP